MSRFIESIRWEDGRYYLLDYHAARMERTYFECLGVKKKIDLAALLPPPGSPHPVQKCRVLYDSDGLSFNWSPYRRVIHSGHLFVNADGLSYAYKYADRRPIEQLFGQAPPGVDIILVRDGLVTDASYSNLVFFDGAEWFTPDPPLLPGVMRACLLDQKLIRKKQIRPSDMRSFQVFKKINAMNPFHLAPAYFVNKINKK